MGIPWPPPSADDHTYGAGRRPNYAMRRALVLASIVVVGAVGGWFVLGRNGDTESASGRDTPAWDAVVLQRTDGSITVVDRDGEELAEATTDLVGVTDIGLTGKVLLGLGGDPAATGIGVLSLDDGSIDEIDVAFDQFRLLGRSSLLVSYDPAGTGLELIDSAASSTIDLLDLAGGDDPLVDALSVRVDDEATHVAFTELRSAETVVVDVAARTGVSLPGALVELAFDRVLTSTNRGDTVLLDLSDVGGERVGTVETAPIVGAMLVDDSTAVVVTTSGVVSLVNFDDSSVDEVTRLATVLPLPPGTDVTTDPEIIDGAVAIAGRTRIALFGQRFVALVDQTGALVRSVDVAKRMTVFLDPLSSDQCLSVGEPGGPYTLLDARTGAIITSFDDGSLVSNNDDGCIAAFRATGATASDVVAGVDLDRRLDDRVLALAADGSAAIQASASSVSWVDLGATEATEPAELLRIRGRDARVEAAAFAVR